MGIGSTARKLGRRHIAASHRCSSAHETARQSVQWHCSGVHLTVGDEPCMCCGSCIGVLSDVVCVFVAVFPDWRGGTCCRSI